MAHASGIVRMRAATDTLYVETPGVVITEIAEEEDGEAGDGGT